MRIVADLYVDDISMIKLNNVCKTFDDGKHVVVDDLSLEINDGELLVILGSSGSGKTTTLKMINRLVEPSSGIIEIDGKNNKSFDPVTLRLSIGYTFQQVGLFPHMSVEDNVTIVLKLLKIPYKDRLERAHELLKLMNLDPEKFAKRMICELSGGQQQRVGVARALANRPRYLLMDEPFGALDAITRISLQDELLRLHAKLHMTIVFVTHDIFEAFRLADRIVVMHQGKIHQVGSKDEIINHPATDFVHDLIQKPSLEFAKIIETITER